MPAVGKLDSMVPSTLSSFVTLTTVFWCWIFVSLWMLGSGVLPSYLGNLSRYSDISFKEFQQLQCLFQNYLIDWYSYLSSARSRTWYIWLILGMLDVSEILMLSVLATYLTDEGWGSLSNDMYVSMESICGKDMIRRGWSRKTKHVTMPFCKVS